MRLQLTGNQRQFFQKEGYIEFENIFNKESLLHISNQIDQVLLDRNPKLGQNSNPQDLFQISRDVWRNNSDIKNFICNRRLTEIISQLLLQNFVYVACDDVFRTFSKTGFNPYPHEALQNFSCIQPLLCTALIHLKGSVPSFPLIPKSPENIVIFAPDFRIKWDHFFSEPNQSFLLISYASKTASYLEKPEDPKLHELKKFGYAFGDRLNPSVHPFLNGVI